MSQLPSDPSNPLLANPLPFGPPAPYQGGLSEDLMELGFPPPRPDVHALRVPGDGHFVVPHVATFQAIVNLASRTYYANFEESLRDSRTNTYVMRYDPTIMSAVRDRQVPVIQLPWHVEAEDESDGRQKKMADEMMRILRAIPRFFDLRRQLLEAIWYGKYGVQLAYRWDYSQGMKRMMVRDHAPVMGDKIILTFGGRPGILVHGAYQGPRVMTDQGVAHLLSSTEREQFILHTFEPEDADLLQGEFAGQRYGYGVRGRIYWWWWQRNVVMQWLMDFLQTIGVGGIMIYYYEEGNDESLQAATNAANNQQSSQAILMPRRRSMNGGVDEVNKVDRIEASQAGADLIYKIIVDYFNQVIRDYIMMERLTTRTGATGLGSQVGAAHERTAADRQRYDAESLDETLTRDLVWVIQRYTWPHMPPESYPLKFKSDVDQPNPLDYMTAAKTFIELGGTIKEDKARAVLGFEKPKAGDAILGIPSPPQVQPPGEDEAAASQAGRGAGIDKGGGPDLSPPDIDGNMPLDRRQAALLGWETRRQGRIGQYAKKGKPHRPGAEGDGEPEKKKYASTQVEFPVAVAQAIQSLAGHIEPGDLAEEGVEDRPHVTVRYGLEDADQQAAEAIIRSFGPIKVRLGELNVFENEDADVLYVSIYSPDLKRLNEALAELPHTDTHPEYTPHATIAYLQPGTAENYLDLNVLDGQEVTFDKVIFSTSEKVKTAIPLDEQTLQQDEEETMRADKPDSPWLNMVEVRWVGNNLVQLSGEKVPDHIKSAAVPKMWSKVRISLDVNSPIWLAATDNGRRKTIYNPVLAVPFAKMKEAMERTQSLSNADLLQMAKEKAVEHPFTPEDLLAVVATRFVMSHSPGPEQEHAEYVREVSEKLAGDLGVPVKDVVEKYVLPQAW